MPNSKPIPPEIVRKVFALRRETKSLREIVVAEYGKEFRKLPERKIVDMLNSDPLHRG